MPGRPADAAGELRDLIEQRADVIDRLVRTLAQLTGAPIGLVTVVEDDAVRVVSRHGIEPAAVELEPGLFAAAMAVDDVYVVPDTHADEAAATDPSSPDLSASAPTRLHRSSPRRGSAWATCACSTGNRASSHPSTSMRSARSPGS